MTSDEQGSLSTYFVRSTRMLQPHGSTYMSQLPSSIGLFRTFMFVNKLRETLNAAGAR